MAYVYRHIRLDINEPFYVGMGISKNRFSQNSGRSKDWQNIASLNGFYAEIIMDNLTIEEAKRKEIEFISIYGRKSDGTGILINHTIGGEDGVFKKGYIPWSIGKSGPFKGKKFSKSHRENISKNRKGKPITFTIKRLASDARRQRIVIQMDMRGNIIKEYDSLRIAVKETGLDCGGLSKAANGILTQSGGFKWKYKNLAHQQEKAIQEQQEQDQPQMQ